MLALAGEWGWLGNGTKNDLDKLLHRMIDESDPNLSFGYIKLDEVHTLILCLSMFYEPDGCIFTNYLNMLFLFRC